MKIDVTFEVFLHEFTRYDMDDSFSFQGLRALFEYLDEFEDNDDTTLDAMVIGLGYDEWLSVEQYREAYGPDADPEDYSIATLENGSFITISH